MPGPAAASRACRDGPATGQSLSSELAVELAAFRAEAARRLGEEGAAAVRDRLAAEFELDHPAAAVIVELLEAQERLQRGPRLPTGCSSRSAPAPEGPGLVYTFHAPLHRAACEAMARAVGARLGRRFGRNLTLAVADLGWSIRLPEGDAIGRRRPRAAPRPRSPRR